MLIAPNLPESGVMSEQLGAISVPSISVRPRKPVAVCVAMDFAIPTPAQANAEGETLSVFRDVDTAFGPLAVAHRRQEIRSG